MSTASRRELLTGAARLVALACIGVPACSASPSGPPDPPGTHPALRRPRPVGTVAFLGVTGDPAAARAELLAARSAGDVTVGLGASLCTDPGDPLAAGLTRMPAFVGEVLLAERSNPDAFVQIEGDDAGACSTRLDEVLAGLPGLATRWRTPVHRDLAGTADGRALQRNPFGWVEGQTNPAAEAAQVVLRPSGAALVAVRVIRMAHELWATDEPSTRERTIGRRADGTWLDGTPPAGTPRFADDPDGAVTALTSHVRTMNPRTPDRPAPRMLRRSWIYQGPTTAAGTADDGVVFMAFQNDFATGFGLAQQRLPADDLHRYLLAVGGGYFVVPGV
jgi:Dyp-type peroxidase family